jgi:hypothetical protein
VNIGTELAPVVVADVNGDRKPDLLGIGPAGLFVLLGNGDGTFSPGGGPYSFTGLLATGDFNGDGKLDIVVATGGSLGSINTLLGNGDGTFQSPITSKGVVTVAAIASGDFNGDGKLDLVLADSWTGQTYLLLGNGDGAFQPTATPLPGAAGLDASDVNDVVATDLNGDGKLDLVIQRIPFVQILLGNGDGSFTRRNSYLETTLTSTSVVTADFNNDGKPDVAAGNAVFLGNGDGTFRGNSSVLLDPFSTNLGTLHFPVAAVSGDFNQDGNPDIAAVVLDTVNSNICWLPNRTEPLSIRHHGMIAISDWHDLPAWRLVTMFPIAALILNYVA